LNLETLAITSETFCFPGPTPSISSAPDLTGGIVWALRNGDYNHRDIPADLYAYDARNLGRTLYSSRVYADLDSPGAPVKFTVPTVANGNVYVGGQKEVAVYGILPIARVAIPSFSLLPATLNGTINVGLSDRPAGSTIYFTTDDTDPVNSPTRKAYQSPISLSATTTIKARATQPGSSASPLAAATYTILPPGPLIDFRSGFSVGRARIQLNGHAQWKNRSGTTRLRLTDGGIFEASSAFYKTPIDIRRFTTDFNVQLLSAMANGMTFTIQENSASALGDNGGALGYGGSAGIPKSIAVKLDLYNLSGEGVNSTGLYTNGAVPDKPAVSFPSGTIDLHSTDIFNVHLTYDGARLTMTVTDLNQPAKTFKTSWPVKIPQQVGANSAYVGFTAGTGYGSAVQDIISWTFMPRIN
jgi:Legume lectin domain/Fn3 associated